MSENRIQLNTIIDSQVPSYIREEFPLVSEFLSQYYISQEFKGAPVDLIQNIDKYIKLDENFVAANDVELSQDLEIFEDVIYVQSDKGTEGFPKTYGIIKIDDEIIVYSEKTDNSFVGCFRGFSGISSYENTGDNNLLFSESEAAFHSENTKVLNLSNLFLNEFLKKIKYQFLPGFENRTLDSNLNQSLFIKQSRDFYSTRGTEESFKILFKALYGTDVKIINPKEYLFRPSDSNYRVTNDLIVEPVEGDPLQLIFSNLFQDEYNSIESGYGPIAFAEKIYSDNGDYYKLGIDSGYNRDIEYNGSVYGRFTVHQKTKVVGNVSTGSTVVDVDSTVGFPNSGELYVTFDDNSIGSVAYTSKSINQFFGCSNITKSILDKTQVGINTYAYGYSFENPEEIIKVRVTSVLSNLVYDENYGMAANDPIEIKTLGTDLDDVYTKEWIYNVPSSYQIENITLIDSSNNTYSITTKAEHSLFVGDFIILIDNNNVERTSKIDSVVSQKEIRISGQGSLNLSNTYILRKNISKGTSTKYPHIQDFNTDIQNVYRDKDDILVASSSIPSYKSEGINPLDGKIFLEGGTYLGETFKITSDVDHGFFTGDAVYYTPEKSTVKTLVDGTLVSEEIVVSSLFTEGLYYVKRVDSNNIKLSKSRANIDSGIYVSVESSTLINSNSHKLEKYNFLNKTLSHQKLFRKISNPSVDGISYPTFPGKTGILINGVEILNYKSNDSIVYGDITNIDVINEGFDYDVINPPLVSITDSVGTGATGYCAVSGALEEIRIIDPGFDYVEEPIINITGGNGTGALARANLSLVDHQVSFYADASSAQVSLASSTVGFTTYHKFRSGESIVYDPDGNTAIGGLTTSSTYYVSVQDFYTIKLHKTELDAVSGINTIALSSYGEGRQYFKSSSKKSVISTINVVSPGVGYQNKKRTFSTSGINTAINTIEIENHDYLDKEILVYSQGTSPIGGLVNGSEYYVTVVDQNTFKLSEIGVGNTLSTFFYDTKQYINFTSEGEGIHSFNYRPINVEVLGNIGIASTSDSTFKAQVQPIFRGSVTSIHLQSGGAGYGSEDILNYERLPEVSLVDGKNAQVTAVINNGSIQEVLIDNKGSGYIASPTLDIVGDGSGAILTPIIQNGQLTSVKVIAGGIGYLQETTSISVTTPGNSAILKPNIRKWTVNLFQKNINNVVDDDGFLTTDLSEKTSLQYSHLYAPRKLRESVYSIDSFGRKLYGKFDLIKNPSSSTEIPSTNHSPIIGWSYDGNPIYGPYGYAKSSGGSFISQMKSSYRLDIKPNRPSTTIFEEGFFVEDYSYFRNDDESYLDENNGRYCVTPDFPKGTYAYFATVNSSFAEDEGNFKGYKIPVFPYVIGNNYYSRPIDFNFDTSSNQDDYDLNQTNWIRNTKPYNLINGIASYQYVNVPNNLDQKSIVRFASPGSIERIGILTGGDNYKVNDELVFDQEATGGENAKAIVSLIDGKVSNTISVASSIISNVEIYPDTTIGKFVAISDNPHEFNSGDVISISGLTTTSSLLEGFYKIGFSTSLFTLNSGVATVSSTGLVTDFSVSGNLSNVRENDILSVSSVDGVEQVKILNINFEKSKIRVLRSVNGIGVTHAATDIARKLHRDFSIDTGFKTSFSYKINKELYFNPIQSVGLGTTSGVGITSTLFFDSISDQSQIGIGTGIQSIIYFNNQKDYQKYNSGGYVDIVNSTDVGFNTSSKKIVAVGSTTVTIDFDTSSLSGLGVTAYLNRRNAIEIPTRSIYFENHQIQTGDLLTYSQNGGDPIGVSTDGVTSFNLTDNSYVYAARISDNLLGISTVKIGIGSTGNFVGLGTTTTNSGLLYLTGIGTGTYHSFSTNYETLRGNISRSIVTVSTASSNGLKSNDVVYVDVNPATSKTFSVRYNDYSRRLIIDPKDFTSGNINTSTFTITINNHGFEEGQKVLHTAQNAIGGLQNNSVYYVVVIDNNNIRLSNTYYDSVQPIPSVVSIASTDGTLSAINPPIKVYKNSTITFDLSDSSLSYVNQSQTYPAFGFGIFKDENFTQEFKSTEKSNIFSVSKTGTVGVSSDAKLTLNVNKDFPNKLYYNLYPIYDSNLPIEKSTISVDTFTFNNELQILSSVFNGRHNVVSAASTYFTYQLFDVPEETSYTSANNSSINYKTTSTTSSGTISEVKIKNGGKNYLSLPEVAVSTASTGTGAEFEVLSRSVGNIERVKIQNIGYDYPTDKTLRPTSLLPQILKIETLNRIDSIGVTSFGSGYTTAPKLLLFDGRTNTLVNDVDLVYKIGNSNVEILKNTNSLYAETPTIIPVENSNGVPISNVGFNTITYDVILTLGVGFSTENSFPFAVNDKILVENISVGINSDAKGYNSEDYDYQLFTVTQVNPNLGGIGSITYNLSEYLSGGEIPGTYDSLNSFGRVVNQKDFPSFDISLVSGEYLKGEVVHIGINSFPGTVINWDPKTNILKVSCKERIQNNSLVVGQTSKVLSIASSVTTFDASYELSSTSKVEDGWRNDVGTLNSNIQVLQDGNYYQNFSYSVKSTVDYDTWNDAVSTLNHISGFKKFSELDVESTVQDESSLTVGVTSSLVEVISDNISVIDLNCYPDFDLVGENAFTLSSKLASDEIIFGNKILTDYLESVSNRVLSIDDISGEFNSNPRATNYSTVDRFRLTDGRVQKYITFVRDRRFTSQRQLMLVTLLQANSTAYLNQYARVETTYDLGSFDFSIDGSDGLLQYYPTNYTVNDYDVTTLTYRLKDGLSGTGSTTLGTCALLETDSTLISGQTTIVSIASSYRSAKILVEIDSDGNQYEFDEINLIHDGTNVDILEYGQLTSHSFVSEFSSAGLGTYYPYISGSDVKVDFIPSVGSGTTININTMYVALADENSTGIGTETLNHALIECSSTSISASGSPVAVGIASYKSSKNVPAIANDVVYNGMYGIVQVTDTTNNRYQMSEIVIVDFDSSTTTITEFGILNDGTNLGTIDANVNGYYTEVTFTPIPSIDVEVKIYLNAMRYELSEDDIIDFTNGSIESGYGEYRGTDSDIKRQFNLTHKNYEIFRRSFDASDSTIVNLLENTITIPNHFFVTGEKLTYDNNSGIDSSYSVGIATTTIVGYGSTDKLPSSVYAVKVNENTIKLAGSAEDSLKSVPDVLDFTSVGIGTSHFLTSTNQNPKVLISVDNIIQSPVVSTAITSRLAAPLTTSDDVAYFTGITSFFGGELIKIGSEIMKIAGVGIGSTNTVRLVRPWMGTTIVGHSSDALITKVVGNYNIVDNTLNFAEAPYGNVPESLDTNPPDERDWVGISTGSSFSGRVFLRSGITNSSDETYSKNYVFDDISSQFNSLNSSFQLLSDNSNVSGITSESIVLVNDIFQGPGQFEDYNLIENAGITTLNFVGTARSITSDVGISSFPKGGLIISVGSTEGFGYQPLVAAGGTAIVSGVGTISSVSIGNSGSGYRVGVQTVRVGVQTNTSSIEFIGTAVVSGGNIVSIAITNPGSGYTSTNPPTVVFDYPLSYSNIPLVYSSSSVSGSGSTATIDIVVGQGSSVIDFEINNVGYGYNVGEILTVPVGGLTGIPTTSAFSGNEFQITIDRTFSDKFTGWSIGELQVIDSIEDQFNGNKKDFQIKVNEELISIRASKGSNIVVQDNIIVFINNILQVPGEGYVFPGGSIITFSEAPKQGDTARILFYKGSGSVDVISRDILETVKVGDELVIGYDSTLGQPIYYQETDRTVTQINSTELVKTSPYFGPGNVADVTLRRPVTWCKQTEDKIVNGIKIGKDRQLYEPSINPFAYLISSVGIGSTVIYVDNLKPFFNAQDESYINLDFQDSVTLISQDSSVSAAATAIVSIAGTISSIAISEGGSGYVTSPEVTIENPVGLGTTQRASATATISSGEVTSIIVSYGGTETGTAYTTSNPPVVLISPPTLIKEINPVSSYDGDSGIVVGFGTTTIGSDDHVIFDLFIPQNSYLRNTNINVGVATTGLSGISTGDYFVIHDSNISLAVGNFNSLDSAGSIIGIGTSFADSVYQVNSYETLQQNVAGVGVTYVNRVFARVSDIDTALYSGSISTSTYFGEYSWGKITLSARSGIGSYTAHTLNGFVGITTSIIVERTIPLKDKNYRI